MTKKWKEMKRSLESKKAAYNLKQPSQPQKIPRWCLRLTAALEAGGPFFCCVLVLHLDQDMPTPPLQSSSFSSSPLSSSSSSSPSTTPWGPCTGWKFSSSLSSPSLSYISENIQSEKKIRQGFSTRHPSKEMLTGRWLQMQQKLQLITHNVAYFLQVCSRLASTFTTSNKGINCSNRRKKKIKGDLHDQRHQQYVWMSGVWSHIHDHKRIHRHPHDWICCTPWET